jgi:hypothetical protein
MRLASPRPAWLPPPRAAALDQELASNVGTLDAERPHGADFSGALHHAHAHGVDDREQNRETDNGHEEGEQEAEEAIA